MLSVARVRTPNVAYRLDEQGRFHIDGYLWARSFSNFFPGIAGLWGIPTWAFYVNRGQALCSLGVGSKDHQILEFHSFNKACLTVGTQSFRTFLRIDGETFHEPFRKTPDPAVRQTMTIAAGELELTEHHTRLGLEVHVTYFPLSDMPLAGMVRRVTITNTGRKRRSVAVLDGVARVLPFGVDQKHIKFIPRHVEGMMGVAHVDGVPLFRLKQTAADSEKIDRIEGGNFYLAVDAANARKPAHVVVDPEAVFGDMAYDTPWVFTAGGLKGVLGAPQIHENKTPCAFTAVERTLAPGASIAIDAVLGFADTDARLRDLGAKARRKGFFDRARAANEDLLNRIQEPVFTVSGAPELDAYCRQDFLDNVMRGGMPMMLPTADGERVYYVYSRQNGDLERDYHHFVLQPNYLSQGTGHYRSVLQNRRTDGWFWPETEDANLSIFLNLIQLDGYNPLEVNEHSYRVVDPDAARAWLARRVRPKAARRALEAMLEGNFAPGKFLLRAEELLGRLDDPEAWLRELMPLCRENELGGLHEGFWADHWTYNLDLLDTFTMIFPDRLERLLLGRRDYTYFDDPDVVLPRAEKCVDAGEGRIRRYGAVRRDPEKLALLAARPHDRYVARTRHGRGAIYRTTLLAKLLCLIVNRAANLDPFGVGMDMEADKPGWNDSMNGLPGLFGSSLCETLELRRAVHMLLGALERVSAADVALHEELASFMETLGEAIGARLRDRSQRASLRYWERSNALKESYRSATRLGVSGKEHKVPVDGVKTFLARVQELLDTTLRGEGAGRAKSPDGVPYTYFVHEVSKHRPAGKTSHQGLPLVEPLAFRQRPVRLFLEGPVHYMKVFPDEARDVYQAVRRSDLFDRKLRMYKACEDMTGESFELGRAVGAYPRGWIENESIYLHMEYKYLLEILRSGLCAEFFRDIRTTLMPFLDPKVYGRNVLEGASFIVSSAYADARMHGQAFQPRLSGLTCEFLHMWILMVAGEKPFRTSDDGRLELALRPRLADWLFTKAKVQRRYLDDGAWKTITIPERAFAFRFMNRCLVVYRNPSGKATYGRGAVGVASHALTYRDGRRFVIEGDTLPELHAHAVRDGAVRRLDVTLA